MTTVLRRIFGAALIAALAGIGAVIALLDRRPGGRGARRMGGPAPVATPQLIPRDRPDHRAIGNNAKPLPQRARLRPTGIDAGGGRPRKAGGGRGFVVGVVVCLLLLMGLAGVVYEKSGAMQSAGYRVPDGDAKPLATLSPPEAGTDRTMPPAGGMPTGSVRAPEPGATTDRLPSQPPRPDFDVVRVEPTGDAVIAGRAAPNAGVEMLVNGRPVARARAGADGHFTLTPPPLPAGNSEIVLRATDEMGRTEPSTTRVAVVVAPARDAKPLVAITAPGRPTSVLSQPDTSTDRIVGSHPPASAANRADAVVAERSNVPAPDRGAANPAADLRGSETGDTAARGPGRGEGGASSEPAKPAPEPSRAAAAGSGPAAPPKVVSIDAQDGGKLFVTARGEPGSAMRLYLNETLIAPAIVGRDGTVTFTIGRGLRPGDYKVRLDLVDPTTGRVSDRAEVPFSASGPGHDAGVEYSAGGQSAARQAAGPETSDRQASEATPSPGGERRFDQVRPVTTGSLAANMPPGAGAGSADVHIPGIETARIERGDSLWRISRRTYGEGERYILIFDANKEQIRDPDLIYPGQVFVLPREHEGKAIGDGRPR